MPPGALLVLLVCATLSSAAMGADLPHVDDCFMCQKCHTGKPPGRRLLARGELHSNGVAAAGTWGSETGRALRATASAGASSSDSKEQMYVPPNFKFSIMPTAEEIAAKSAKRNCTECYGCDTQIVPLSGVTNMHGMNVTIETGASSEWLFFADLPDTGTTGRKAVLKVWCMPIDKVHKTFSWRCSNTGEGAKAVQFLMAQQKVMEECGLMDVTIKVRPGRVNAVVPGTGLHVWWDGLWMEKAEGLSLNQISYRRTKAFVTEALTSMLGEKLNKTRVVRAAIHDLLTSQCDRHSQNVFLNSDGNIKLIDNLQALQFSWYNCAMDSIFLPGTQKNAILRWGGNVVFKMQHAKPRRSTNPMVVLDYRCYVEDGQIGTSYDPTLRQCLSKLSKMTAEQVQKEYGFPYKSSAAVLQQRAADMINKGFEWALRYGEPQNYKPKVLRPQQPCCKLAVTKDFNIQCGHEWDNSIAVPLGEPKSGGEWRRPYKDPGSYEGGTFVDPPFKS